MKKIGKGWQFNVYKISEERVLKVPLKYMAQLLNILISAGPFIFFKKPIKRVRQESLQSFKNLRDVISDEKFPLYILGNPIINFKTLEYSQDLVEPLSKYFKRTNYVEKEKIIRLYPNLIHKIWQFGFSDKVFNFTLNNGIDKNGNLVLLDIGELDFVKEDVVKDIKSKRWLRAYSYLSLKDKKLKEVYRQVMEKELTLENLEKEWGKYNK